MRRIVLPLALAATLATTTACTHSTPAKLTGRPSCTDTAAAANRLKNGCELDGHVYRAIVTRCANGTTMYNVPAVPPHGASGFSGGKLRTHAVSTTEDMTCTVGSTGTK